MGNAFINSNEEFVCEHCDTVQRSDLYLRRWNTALSRSDYTVCGTCIQDIKDTYTRMQYVFKTGTLADPLILYYATVVYSMKLE